MKRFMMVLTLAAVFMTWQECGALASGCGKDCGANQAVKPQDSGCRVMFGSGILYDKGTAITVSAPEGWVIDDQSGAPAGLHAVFYPEGGSWADADTVMYAQIVHKDSCCSSTLEKVMQKDEGEPAQSRLDVAVEDGGTLKTTKGKDAHLRLYSGGLSRAVAYVDEEKVVARLVAASRTGEALKDAMPAFREFVGTYLFVSDTVDVNRNCMSGPGTAPGVRTVEYEGEVSSVGDDGLLLVFKPDGSASEVTVRAESGLSSGIRPGDRVRVAYNEGEVNLATKVLKLHRISRLPKPCVPIH